MRRPDKSNKSSAKRRALAIDDGFVLSGLKPNANWDRGDAIGRRFTRLKRSLGFANVGRNRARSDVFQNYFLWIWIVRFAVSTSLRLGMRKVNTPSAATASIPLSSTSSGSRKVR